MFVVKWVTPTGEQGWHEVDDVTDAVAKVEDLRNGSGIEGAQIFRLEHVAFEFKPYYRVELADAAPAAPATPPVSFAASIAPDPAPEAAEIGPAAPAMPEPEPEPVAAGSWPAPADATIEDSNGAHRRGLFGR
jgi:hypothetical protein